MGDRSDDEATLRVGEAAQLLGIDARAVYAAIETGELTGQHVEGHGIRLQRREVEAFGRAH